MQPFRPPHNLLNDTLAALAIMGFAVYALALFIQGLIL